MYFTIEPMFEKDMSTKGNQPQNITPPRQDLTRLLELGELLSNSLAGDQLTSLFYDQPLLLNANTSQEEE